MNKKVIKTIVCTTCGLGIVSSIPFMTTSCGSSTPTPEPEPFVEEPLPYDKDNNVFAIKTSEDGKVTITGFKGNFDITVYPNANTLVIPKWANDIANLAFCGGESQYWITTLPDQITCLRYEEGFKYFSDDTMVFSRFGYFTSIKIIDFSNVHLIYSSYCFCQWRKLNTIKFDSSGSLPEINPATPDIGRSAIFKDIPTTGRIITYGNGEKTTQQFKDALINVTETKDRKSPFHGWRA